MHRMLKLTLTFYFFLGCLFLTPKASAIGLLVPNDASVRPFDVESHRASVKITNNAAVTTVKQVFRNHTDRPMEAVFVFPIPEGGTVSDFSLWINGKKTKGAVLEKKEARRIYERIVRRVRDPGLIEYMDGKLFRASIFPIPPKGTQKLELKFGQVLERQGGMFQYTYPLAAGRKYVTAKTAKDFTLTAELNSTIPITSVYSPSHKVGVHRKSDSKVLVGTEQMHAELDRDFELYLGYSKKDIGVSLMTYRPEREKGYFMLAIAPRVEAKAHDEIGQTFTFVIDTSGSMAGEKIEQARKTLAFCVKRLRPQDHFNVVRFSTDVEALFQRPVKATKAHKKSGVSFANELMPAGGTAIDGALKKTLAQRTPKDQPHQVIFITDGHPTVGPTAPAAIVSNATSSLKRDTRLFTFGVGYQLNTKLLDALAGEGRGRSDYVHPNEDMESAVSALYSRISSPVLSDISIDFGKTRTYDVYPTPVPDLFEGDQIVLFGRYRGKKFGGPVVVSGRIGSQKKTFRYDRGSGNGKSNLSASAVAPLEFLPKLWATRKVGFLLDQIRVNGEQPELKKEVIRLAKKFGLVTPYTSYLAVDDSEFQQQNRRRRQSPPPPRDRRADVDRSPQESESLDSLGSSGGGGRTQSVRPRPRRSRAPAAKRKADAFGGFESSSGEEAVAASEATREYKEADKVDDDSGVSRKFVAGRTFELKNGVWIQEGLSGGETTKVEAYSEEFFALVKKHPELKTIATLGEKIIVRLGGKNYRIVP